MKILVISSRFPPYHFGGYGLRCKNIVDALAGRGHVILVLSSQKEAASHTQDSETAYPILRALHLHRTAVSLIDRMTLRRWSYLLGIALVFIRETMSDLKDTALVDKEIKRFQPDLIYLGHTINLSRTLLPYLASCKIPLVYDEGGSGLIDSWKDKGIWYKLIEKFAETPSFINKTVYLFIDSVCRLSRNRLRRNWIWPNKMKVVFNSELNYKNAVACGLPTREAMVIHSGIDTKKFCFRERENLKYPLIFLVPSRIEPRKGQLDAVRLLAKLKDNGINSKMILVGEKLVPSYYRQVVDEIRKFSLDDKIKIQPMVSHEFLATMYREADFCFFPSYQMAGLSRIPLEAMACGCLIISYGSEGSDEIIRNRSTGFLVTPTDYSGIVDVVRELVSDPGMARSIVSTARKEIEEKYSMERYIDRIEKVIMNAVEAY